MLVALFLGGGGAVAPLHNLAIQLLALAVLALIGWHGGRLVSGRAERLALVFGLLVVATPLLQLVPLPYPVWTVLPGRDLAAMIGGFANEAGDWRPISLDPEATWLAAAFLLPPAAMFLAVSRLGERDRSRLVQLFVMAAICSLALAAVQIAAGDGALRLYDTTHNAFATGFFANRNHQADLLLIALIFVSVLIWRGPNLSSMMRWSLWLAAALGLSAGVIATASRMGFLLLPLALLASATFIPLAEIRRRGASLAWALAAGLAAVAFVAASAGLRKVLGRFDILWDARFEFWSDTLLVAKQYFPWGSGIGTFDTVYRANENLNRMGAPYLNHAHNDYIQILIETGLWGCLLVLVFFALFGWLSFRKVDAVPFRRAAAFSILILLLHSAVDYPLRMLSLLTLFGFLCALLFPARAITATTRRRNSKAV